MRRLILFLLCLYGPMAYGGVPIDFSRVGYMWGEKQIPDYPVKVLLDAPLDGADMTAVLQEALDNVEAPGAVLLKAGVYNISGSLNLKKDGVVLRGEGEKTVLVATGTQQRTFIVLGKDSQRSVGDKSPIIDKFTPVGQMWVRVKNPALFVVGDRVAIGCRVNDRWISDLRMDQIAQNPSGRVKQWEARKYTMRWERIVVRVQGDRIWFDNPIVMELDSTYLTSAWVEHVEWDRTVQSGVENLKLISEYDESELMTQPSGKFKGLVYCADEDHAWTAINVCAAEHCWVRNVTSAHFVYACVSMRPGAKNITVRDCLSTEPISVLTGSRRYAFSLAGGELCLFERCRAENDRHGFVTSAKVPGPNVFLECEMVNAFTDVGPHHRWSTGVLYDSCITDGLLAVQDRAGWGTGHGWAGVNFVFWNCVANDIICQSPWVNGKNWCIGCIGIKKSGRKYDDGIARPDGEWKSHGKKVSPGSLYRYQLARRKTKIATADIRM